MTAEANVCALVLAAGGSRRMGRRNKLLLEIGGTPMVARAVEVALASRASWVRVVTGAEAREVRGALRGHQVSIVHNPDYGQGLSTSLRAGLSQLPKTTEGVLVCLADMPWVRAAQLDLLVAAFVAGGKQDVCVPVHAGRRGNPILWPARCFEAMQAITGDRGARALLESPGERVVAVEVGDNGIHRDIDTPADVRQ
ncbi:MAG: nucleotidyltransferase family protein [Myxococcales bacterium]|nr:nucleotidyltransferase family protein [Myxococcales bacterium]